MVLVPAALVMLLVGATTGYAGEAVIGVVATQVGFLAATLMAAQRSAVTT
jgi:hypothetical protein